MLTMYGPEPGSLPTSFKVQVCRDLHVAHGHGDPAEFRAFQVRAGQAGEAGLWFYLRQSAGYQAVRPSFGKLGPDREKSFEPVPSRHKL